MLIVMQAFVDNESRIGCPSRFDVLGTNVDKCALQSGGESVSYIELSEIKV